ncbi:MULTISPECIES: EF-hand domain-containing protein [Roseobacteraceae]|nr:MULTISPECIES: EF-hand domain-containing protein [Roseobacteraceae]MBT3142980.1 EF-hand domain-containing protein [Falsiruegeria litorea]MBT8166915.1 EF-hand domain-containing protein [Falsiruegeria litorea]
MKRVTYSAIVALAFASGAIAQTMPGEALLLLDGDGDSQITLDEFKQQMDAMFDGMDTNQNGQLETSEVESFIAQEVFDATDTDANGSISKSEYDAQIQKDFSNADKNSSGTLD